MMQLPLSIQHFYVPQSDAWQDEGRMQPLCLELQDRAHRQSRRPSIQPYEHGTLNQHVPEGAVIASRIEVSAYLCLCAPYVLQTAGLQASAVLAVFFMLTCLFIMALMHMVGNRVFNFALGMLT
jgi:hypothetical protein